MTKRINRKLRNKTYLSFGILEPRQCLSSVGWDGPGNGSAVLTYYIGPVPEGVDQATFNAAIEDALDVWAAVADIHFLKTDIPAQEGSLDITFAELDGRGGMLANAYFPDDVNPEPYAGDIQFDASETWEIGNGRGDKAFDLMYVAVHEIGHALGLDHSEVDGSIMNGLVEPGYEFRQLTVSDVEAIHQLYGRAADDSDSPRDPEREPLDETLRLHKLDPLRLFHNAENGGGTKAMETTNRDSLPESRVPNRNARNDALDQWASQIERDWNERALDFSTQEQRLSRVDLDSSLQPAELGVNLDSQLHDHLLSPPAAGNQGRIGLRV